MVGRSCFDYFHPEEVSLARLIYRLGVTLDKAALLHHVRIKGQDNHWVGCVCVSTIIYDVIVAVTSMYRRDTNSQSTVKPGVTAIGDRILTRTVGRAAEAYAVRRLFASSSQDPCYYMLPHLSVGFQTSLDPSGHEPRVAVILNRFTRTLKIMHATRAVSIILGITASELKDRSFYECIKEHCLPEAIRCLEGAKTNESITLLKFWYRDPRRAKGDGDERMGIVSHNRDDQKEAAERDTSLAKHRHHNDRMSADDNLCERPSINRLETMTTLTPFRSS